MNKLKFWHIFIILPVVIFSCGFDIGNWDITRNAASESNYGAFEEINFTDFAYPLTFGTSTNAGNSIIQEGDGVRRSRGPNGGIIPEGALELSSIGNAGKIAGSEDGIAFYFKEVESSMNFIMEADFLVLRFGNGSNPDDPGSNGQEGFGIMVRDFVPQFPGKTMGNWDESEKILGPTNSYHVGASSHGNDSNMIMAGGVKRGLRVYWREGIKRSPDVPLTNGDSGNPTAQGNQNSSDFRFYFLPRELGDYSLYSLTQGGGEPVMAARPDFPSWGTTVRVRLEKTNNGYKYRITPIDDYYYDGPAAVTKIIKPEVNSDIYGVVPLYDISDSVNRENYYVGIFSSRDAVVQVTNIRYWEADSEKCAPVLPQKPLYLNAEIEVLSPAVYTGENYLYVKANTAGSLSVIQGGRRIPGALIANEWIIEKQNGAANPLALFTVPIFPPDDGDNVFNLAFYPGEFPKELSDKDFMLGSNAAVFGNFLMTKKLYHAGTGDIIVGPKGTPQGLGTRDSPLDIQTAINYCQPGQTVEMLDGKYSMDKPVIIPRYNNGSVGARKTLRAETRDRVYLDWQKDETLQLQGLIRGQGFDVCGAYWILDGFHVRGTPDKIKGMVISGYNNIIRYVRTYNNGDTGMQLSGNSDEPVRFWPSGNRVEYCESFHNMDRAETDADGFAAKLTVGKDNEFHWCISHHNNDDGWDLFAKKDTGPIGVVRIFNSISYCQGILLNGYRTRAGHNGFKMGGEGIGVNHEIHQSLSFANGGYAITSNSNPNLQVYDTTTVSADGQAGGNINIYSGDGAAVPGNAYRVVADTVRIVGGSANSATGTFAPDAVMNYTSVLVNRNNDFWGEGYAGITNNGNAESSSYFYEDFTDYHVFMELDNDGKPVLGKLYKPPAGYGAQQFY